MEPQNVTMTMSRQLDVVFFTSFSHERRMVMAAGCVFTKVLCVTGTIAAVAVLVILYLVFLVWEYVIKEFGD